VVEELFHAPNDDAAAVAALLFCLLKKLTKDDLRNLPSLFIIMRKITVDTQKRRSPKALHPR
jgi:hypothetical protein